MGSWSFNIARDATRDETESVEIKGKNGANKFGENKSASKSVRKMSRPNTDTRKPAMKFARAE